LTYKEPPVVKIPTFIIYDNNFVMAGYGLLMPGVVLTVIGVPFFSASLINFYVNKLSTLTLYTTYDNYTKVQSMTMAFVISGIVMSSVGFVAGMISIPMFVYAITKPIDKKTIKKASFEINMSNEIELGIKLSF